MSYGLTAIAALILCMIGVRRKEHKKQALASLGGWVSQQTQGSFEAGSSTERRGCAAGGGEVCAAAMKWRAQRPSSRWLCRTRWTGRTCRTDWTGRTLREFAAARNALAGS